MSSNSFQTDSNHSEVNDVNEKKESFKTPPDLALKVKEINNELMDNGEYLLMNELPKEILRLSERINNEPLFTLSPKELEKELFGSIEEYTKTITNAIDNSHEFVKEHRKEWEKWAKQQKKEKKHKQENIEKHKHSRPVEIHCLPENCRIPRNSRLEVLIDLLNDEMAIVNNIVISIKLWITLKIPRIEDGNNLGVGVQEEHIKLLASMEAAVATIMSNCISSFSSRGEYINNIIQNPGIEDYKLCLLHYDEWLVQQCKVYLYECRNSLALIYDRISKNINWLYTPRMESDVQHIFI